ncbi:MAG: dockerin type I domain-containing protein [Planctomycetota bacterium]|jgi:hypothetical protein
MSILRFAAIAAACLVLAPRALGQCGDPPTDFCSNATELTGWPGSQEVVMGVEGATADLAPTCGVNGGHSVWFKMTPFVNGLLTFSTCHPSTSYDTIVQVYSGSECEFLAPVACSDDTNDPNCDNGCNAYGSNTSFEATAGTTYYFQVSSYNNNSAGCELCLGVLVTLGADCGENPADFCQIPRVLPGSPGVHYVDMDVQTATPDTGMTCTSNPGHTVWFEVTPTISGPIEFSTCTPATTYDTVVQAWQPADSSCGILVNKGCNDDTVATACDNGCSGWGSVVSFEGVANTTYLFEVGSYNQNSAQCGLCLGATLTVAECLVDNDCDDGNPCTESVCDSGICYSTDLPDETPCPDDGAQCTDDICDGFGACIHPFSPAGSACGDPSSSDCDSPDTCNGAGACLNNNQPNGTACTPDGNECTDDVCNGDGACIHRFSLPGTACGDPSSSSCDEPDFCDGAGTCLDNVLSAGSECDTDGNPCTSDICDGLGACTHPFLPEGTACGDPSASTCDGPDSCDGFGVCTPNHAVPGTSCENDANPCTEDICDEAGACAHPFLPEGSPCGDPSASDCDAPDSCNGLGSCLNNNLPAGTECTSDDNDCTGDECNGDGNCIHPPRPAGTPCGDDLYCNGIEECDGSSTCQEGLPPCQPGESCDEGQDRCGTDCNRNGVDDLVDLETGRSLDCNGNVVPDECDIATGFAIDCNTNGVPDNCDLAEGVSVDENQNSIPDECEAAPQTLTRLCEIMVRPDTGDHQWVELYVGQDAAIAGWQISNQRGGAYTIPAALPLPLPGPSVVIHFDGLGPAADDYDFSDGVAELHTPPGMVDIFDPQAGEVALYTSIDHGPETLRSYVAYGGPPENGVDDAVDAGLWHRSWWIPVYVGFGAEEEGVSLAANRTIGTYPGATGAYPNHWITYEAGDVTLGAQNVMPRSYVSTIESGTVFGTDAVAIGWLGTAGSNYQFQLANNPSMTSPIVDTVLAEPFYNSSGGIPAGQYWWRARSITHDGRASAWSPAKPAEFIDAPTVAGGIQQNTLGVTWLRQRKDTDLLCLDGCQEGPTTLTSGQGPWDTTHPDNIYTHGRNNCVRASTAMIATLYGGNISQDRISYEYFERNGSPIKNWGGVGNPHKDLGHDMTTIVCGTDGATGGRLFEWALGLNQTDVHYAFGAPTFNQVRNWIDAGRPLMRFDGVSHQTVIAGYRILANGTQQVRLLDPWSGPSWVNFASINIGCHYVPPAAAPSVRSDEAGISTDTDNDGIMNWDEQNRFHTSVSQSDTDADFVPDKPDIREYVFTTAGQYALRVADLDSDTDRKELDPDNDDDGALDGCEDTNFNGIYEPALGETNNFSASSCGGTCLDGYEPNGTDASAYPLPTGTLRSTIGPADEDFYDFTLTDVMDVQLRVIYIVRPQTGHRLDATLDGISATETTAGTLVLDKTELAPGRHVLEIEGELSTTVNCYRVELSMTSSTLNPDKYDDQTPQGEPRNDTFANAALLPVTLHSSPYLTNHSEYDLNFDVANDVDYFTVQITPETTQQPDCCPEPIDPNAIQGQFRIMVIPEGPRPFEIKLYQNDGSTHSTTSGFSKSVECALGDFTDGKVTFSLRDLAGRNLYSILLGYTACDIRLYPPWVLEYDPPLFVFEIPFFPEEWRLIFPIDPEVVDGYLQGQIEAPFPPEYMVFNWPWQRDYGLDITLPDGGQLDVTLIDQDGAAVAAAGWVDVGEGEPPRKRLEMDGLPAGQYVLEVAGGGFGTNYILDSDVSGDINGDNAVDLRDFAALQGCFADTSPWSDISCAASDINHDNSVDLSDMPSFTALMTGPLP